MGLKLRLTWFDKKNENFVDEEYSKDLGDDESVIDALGLPLEDSINNGEFEVSNNFARILKVYFKNSISLDDFHYFIAFDYRDGDW